MSKSAHKTYPEAFKKQVVALHQGGKFSKDIIKEYELTLSTFDKWRRQFKTTGSFKEKDNLTPEKRELKELRKKNKHLAMENDILKQAALIFAQKSK